MRFSRLLAGLAIATLVGAGSVLAVKAMVQEDSVFLPPILGSGGDVNGVWRSRGYGWIWSVEGGRVRVFEESGDFCMRSPRRTFRFSDAEAEIEEDGKVLLVEQEDDQYRYVFDRIESLPASCEVKPGTDAVSVFDATVDTLAAHYAFFDQRNIDWDKAVEAARKRVTPETSDLQLFRIVSRLLSNFRDSHVSLEGTVGDEEIEYQPASQAAPRPAVFDSAAVEAVAAPADYWSPSVAESLLGDTAETALDDEMLYGLIDDDIGYISIRSMSGYSESEANRAMEKALAMFEDASAVIVDVSLNDGGYDMTAKAIASHFASEETLAYSKYPGDAGQPAAPQRNYVVPEGKHRFDGPVFVLTSETTVSAAEIFVMAMRALPNVTQIGETTDGSLSDILTKPLPNGWELNLSNEVYLDATGAAWEGKGIPPRVAFDVRRRSGDSERDRAASLRIIDLVRSLAADARSRDGA